MTARRLVLFIVFLIAFAAFGDDEQWGEELIVGGPISARYTSHECQDATGRLWATATGDNSDDFVCTWDEGWKTVLFKDGTEPGSFQELREGPDGTIIASCYIRGNGNGEFWQFRGLRCRCADLPDFNSHPPACFYVDNAGKAWLTDGRMDDLFIPPRNAGPVVAVPGEGESHRLFERLLRPEVVCLPVAIDGLGRFWISPGELSSPEDPAVIIVDPQYSDERRPTDLDASWQRRFPVAILDSSGIRYKSELLGRDGYHDETPHTKIVVEPFDDRTMWLGFPDGLWRADITTLRGAPEELNLQQPVHFIGPFPGRRVTLPEDWSFPVSIFQDKEDWYLLCTTTLWRLRGGEWQRLIDKQDRAEYLQPMALLGSHLATERGIWISGRSPALWFVPRDDRAPLSIDWRRNLRLSGCGSIFRMPDGRLIAGGTEVFTESQLLDTPQSAATFDTVKLHSRLVQDAQLNLYGLSDVRDTVLSQWDGETWQKLPIPGADLQENTNPMMRNTRRAIALDDRQRVWVIENELDCKLPCAAYDTVARTWKAYENYLDALFDQPDFRISFTQCNEIISAWGIAYGPEGRIGLSVYKDVFYFDGLQWFHWALKNIINDDIGLFSKVLFEGCLFTFENYQGVWQYIDGKGWQKLENRKCSEGTAWRRQRLPEYCVTRTPDSLAEDRFGTFWFTYNRCFYHAGYGLCLPVFRPNEVSPIVQGFKTDEALIDRKGNAFVGSKSYLVIPPKTAPPEMKIGDRRVEGNRVIVTCGHQADSGVRYVARWGDGDWGQPAKGPEFIVGPLPDGEHTITVFAMDQNLQTSPVPETFQVTISHGAETIESALKDLLSTDLDVRTMAVKSLVVKGKECLEPLREMRKIAAPDVQWWIDAAIQQIEATEK